MKVSLGCKFDDAQLCFRSSVYRSGGTRVIRNEMFSALGLPLFLRNWFVLSGYTLHEITVRIVLYWSAQERLSSSAKLLERLRSRSKERGRVPRAACKTDEVYHPPRGFPDVLKRDRHHPPVKMDCQKMVLNKMCLEEMKLTISRNISLGCIPGIVLVFVCFCG